MFARNPAFVEVISPVEPPDILELARRGDESSFNALFRSHESRLLRQAILLCGEETLARDLTQDTMLEAWKSIHRYNGECRFFTWMCSILIHCHKRAMRRKRPVPFSWLLPFDRERAENGLTEWVDGRTPCDAAQGEERAGVLRRCLARLPTKQRQVVYLRFYVDDSLDAIAAALGCSVGTVKSRLSNALDRLTRMNEIKMLGEDI